MITATPAPQCAGAMITGMTVPSLVVTINFSFAIVILPCFRGRKDGHPFYVLGPTFDGGACGVPGATFLRAHVFAPRDEEDDRRYQ